MHATCCLLLWLAVPVNIQEKGEPVKALEQLQGAWQVVSMEAFGKPTPAEKAPTKLVITGRKLTGLGPDMDIKLDPTKKPKWIDLTFKKGDKPYPVKGIYELRDGELRLCIPLAEVGVPFQNQRPDNFDTKAKARVLLRLKRLKS
jgi:uncharacterized protein (TIGR03067 family)